MVLSNRWQPLDADLSAAGEHVPHREWWLAAGAMISQAMILTYFTADKTETISTVTTYSGTAATATPTLIRIGAYSVAANGNLTLVASTTSDTSLYAAANTAYAKSFSSSWSKVAGTRYALGMLIVSSQTMPSIIGHQLSASTGATAAYIEAPAIVGRLSSQSDLPSSVTSGLITYSFRPAFKLT